jgi:hypothetical protein
LIGDEVDGGVEALLAGRSVPVGHFTPSASAAGCRRFYGCGVSGRGGVELVRFTGGEHSGLVVEAPYAVAERLPVMRFEVLAGGQLYDPVAQCRIPGTRVVTRPGEPPAVAPVVALPSPAHGAADPAPAVPSVVAAPVEQGSARAFSDAKDVLAAASRPRPVPPGAPVFRSARGSGQ